MTVQSEYQLENELISTAQAIGLCLSDASRTKANYCLTCKTQIERANGLAPLSETEWKQVISF